MSIDEDIFFNDKAKIPNSNPITDKPPLEQSTRMAKGYGEMEVCTFPF